MVIGEIEFQHVAQHVRNLVGCDAVRLFLGCAETGLRHPLVKTVAEYLSVGSVGSLNDNTLLRHARIQALCDLALQSGRVQQFEHWQQYTDDIRIQSVLIAPLERPTGVLGFLLLTDQNATAFGVGERLLLRRYVPLVAQKIEADLYHWRESRSAKAGDSCYRKENSATLHDQLWMQQQELELVKNEFVPLLSHELRNPLAAIKGYAILLRAYGVAEPLIEQSDGEKTITAGTVLDTQQQRDYLDHIIEQTRHLEVLINDLLDISRLHAGRLLLRYQEVNVAALCRQMVQSIQAKYSQSSTCEIACTLAPDLPTVWADPNRLQQVVSNVLDNAVKYSPQGGLIEVIGEIRSVMGGTLAQTVQEVSITIRDRGIGIAQEHHHQLFQPFKRLDHALTNEISGVGLGLYITRKLVEAMGGSITLYSREAEGTTVTFSVPCALERKPVNANAVISKQVSLTPI